MNPSSPAIDSDLEASQVSIQPAPGAVFLSLRLPAGRAFVEMTVGEAIALRRALDECIGVAAATATP